MTLDEWIEKYFRVENPYSKNTLPDTENYFIIKEMYEDAREDLIAQLDLEGYDTEKLKGY